MSMRTFRRWSNPFDGTEMTWRGIFVKAPDGTLKRGKVEHCFFRGKDEAGRKLEGK